MVIKTPKFFLKNFHHLKQVAPMLKARCSIKVKFILNILKVRDSLKPERRVLVKFGKTTDAPYVVNSIHRAELNYVGLNFLMRFQLKHLLEETIIKILRNDYFLKSRCKSRFFYFINKMIEIFRKKFYKLLHNLLKKSRFFLFIYCN